MSAQIFYNNGSSSSEVITHLINSSDGQGLHFDGAAGNIDIASPPDLGTKFSMEFIVQADSASDQAYLVDFYKSSPAARFGIFYDGSGSDFYIYDTGNRSFGAGNVLGDTKVHHLVITVDDTAAILYDNGNQVGTADLGASPTIDIADTAKIGSRHNGTGYFLNGTLYRTRFWNKTLSQPEVTASYENATVPFADQYGSQTIVIPGDFDGNLDGWNASNTWNSQTNPSNNMVLAANATGQRCRTSTTLTDNKRYRVTYTATSTSGAPNFAYYDGGYSSFTPTNTGGSSTITNGTNTLEFIFPTTATLEYFYIHATTASDAVTLDDVSVVEIGCVADYDLAFAQPEISTIVQNRNNTVSMDGTASAGVTQVTKIEAVNTNKLNVGGVTPLVGIGLAAGSTPDSKLHIRGVDSSSSTQLHVHNDQTGHAAKLLLEGGRVSGTTDTAQINFANVGEIVSQIVANWGVGNVGDLLFKTSASGTSGLGTRLTISGAGNVGIGVAPGDIGLRLEKEIDGNWAGLIKNSHATNGHGLKVMGGDDASVDAFRVSSAADATLLNINGTGLATFSSGIVTSEKGVLSGSVTVADDAVTTITPARKGGFIFINSDTASGVGGYPQTAHCGQIFFDCGTSLFIFKQAYSGMSSGLDVSTSDVTGTTGTDGNVTVAVQAGVIKIENRAGWAETYNYTILS